MLILCLRITNQLALPVLSQFFKMRVGEAPEIMLSDIFLLFRQIDRLF